MVTTELRVEAYKTALSNPSFFYARGVLESGSTRKHTAAETTALANNPLNAGTPFRSANVPDNATPTYQLITRDPTKTPQT